jgi:hypothetical protein
MPLTHEACTQTGVYESDCEHEVQIAREAGQAFPQCGPCQAEVRWILVKTTLPSVYPPPSGRCPQPLLEPGQDQLEPFMIACDRVGRWP